MDSDRPISRSGGSFPEPLVEKKGLERGREEGREEGMEVGIQQGVEQGKREVALRLIAKGMSV